MALHACPAGCAAAHVRASRSGRQRGPRVVCSAQNALSRRELLFAASLLAAGAPGAAGAGDDAPPVVDALASIIEQSEEDIRLGSTDLVKRLLENSEKNRVSNRKVGG